MADETASTQTSEAATTETAPADAATAATTATEGTTEAAETTALGGGGEVVATTEAVEGAEAAATKEGEEAATGAPEAYELTIPEGMTIDKASLDAATPVFRELGLSNEQAQKLMPVAAGFAQKIADGLNQQILTQVAADRKAWLDTARADPEIGGAKWDQTIAIAAKGLDNAGYPKGSPFRNLLDESGLGNHPEMIRAWARVGKITSEDSDFVRTEHNASVKKTDSELFYPGYTNGPK